jgi:hypothetical protein
MEFRSPAADGGPPSLLGLRSSAWPGPRRAYVDLAQILVVAVEQALSYLSTGAAVWRRAATRTAKHAGD